MTIGERLKAAREAKGLEREDLDELLADDSMYVTMVECEDNDMNLDGDEIVVLCRILQISPAYLLGLAEWDLDECWSRLMAHLGNSQPSLLTEQGYRQLRHFMWASHGLSPKQEE